MEDILETIECIETAEGQLRASEENRQWVIAKTFLDAILYNLVVIGEATKSLTPELRRLNPGVDWRAVAGMWHGLTHNYHHVIATLVMDTLDEPMRVLKQACQKEFGIAE